MPYRFNFTTHIVVERQPLKNSATMRVCLYERDSLSGLFQQNGQAPLRIFISEHKWKDGKATEEEVLVATNRRHSQGTAMW
jgi:hypothetical protein